MLLFAHHMGVEILGREFSPHGVFQHACVFAALSLVAATSAYGTWAIAARITSALRTRRHTGI